MKNSVYIQCFNNPISGHNAFNLLVSIKISDPHIDVNLIHDEISISELTKEQLNYFKKTYQTINEDAMQYNLLNKINSEFVILLHSDMLFFNKPISQIFSKFFKTDFYMSYETIDKTILEYRDKLNKSLYKSYNKNLLYFKKSKLVNIQDTAKNIDLEINFFDKLSIILNNNDSNSNIDFIHKDNILTESEILQTYYGVYINENNRKLITKLLETYQSKVVRIAHIQSAVLVNPLEYKQTIKIVKNKKWGLNLIIQYYKTSDERNKEILQSIKKNIENNIIKNIYVFIEKDAVLNIEHPKLVKLFSKRLTYKEIINQTNENLLNELVMIANSDIYYDNTLQYVLNNSVENKQICLTRYDVLDNQLKFYNNKRSSDTQIFQTPIKEFGDFYMGIPHCDGRICQEAEKIGGLDIVNPSKSVMSYHLHKSGERTQKQEIDYIYGEVYDVDWVSDTNQLSDKVESFVGYQLPSSISGRNELVNFYDVNFKNYKGYVVEVVDNVNLLSGCFISPKQDISVICPNEKMISKTYNIKVDEYVISDIKKETDYYYNGNVGSTDIKYLNKMGISSVNNKKLYCRKLNELVTKKPDILIINTNEVFDIGIDFNYLICKKGIPMWDRLVEKFNIGEEGDIFGVFVGEKKEDMEKHSIDFLAKLANFEILQTSKNKNKKNSNLSFIVSDIKFIHKDYGFYSAYNTYCYNHDLTILVDSLDKYPDVFYNYVFLSQYNTIIEIVMKIKTEYFCIVNDYIDVDFVESVLDFTKGSKYDIITPLCSGCEFGDVSKYNCVFNKYYFLDKLKNMKFLLPINLNDIVNYLYYSSDKIAYISYTKNVSVSNKYDRSRFYLMKAMSFVEDNRRIIVSVSMYNIKNEDDLRRHRMAMITQFNCKMNNDNIIFNFIYDYDIEESSLDIGYHIKLPYIKTLISKSIDICDDSDFVVICNNDICFNENMYDIILSNNKDCFFSYRKDFYYKIDKIIPPNNINSGVNYIGADMFGFTKTQQSLQNDHYPNLFIGRPGQDGTLRYLMEYSIIGVSTFRKNVYNHGGECSIDNLIYHEKHQSFQERDDVFNNDKCNDYCYKKAYDWFKKYSNNNFVGKEILFPKKYII